MPTDGVEPDRARVLDLLRVHGWNATSFQILEPGFVYWFGERGCVAYVDTGRAWVVAGAPVAPPERIHGLADAFIKEARRRGRRVCFFAVEDRFAAETTLSTMRLGEQPVWDPAHWAESRASSRSLREQLRRARAKGVRVRALDASEIADPTSKARAAIEHLVARWLGSRGMAQMGFLVDVKPFALPEERRYFLAETADKTVGFLAAVPVYARKGWLFEDLLRDPYAPNGTAELLVDAAMQRVAEEGARYVTLGLAPLAGDVHDVLQRIRVWTRALYDFEGVHAFKSKLRPHAWVPIHMAWPPEDSGSLALFDALAAFARGSFTRFGIDTLLQGPTFVVRALALLLVPWTLLLALSDAHHWFPAPWVKYAWVGFDGCVALALLWLAARWQRWLGVLLAALVTGDALVTFSEALAYNVARAHRVLDWCVIATSCLAPAFAAAVLWGAVRSRAVLVGSVATTDVRE